MWYFEPILPLSERLLKAFSTIGLISIPVCKIEHQMGDVRNDSGEIEFFKLFADARKICSKIKQERLINNLFINKMKDEWEINKVLLHFEKNIQEEVRIEVLRIGMIKWMLKSVLHLKPEECALLIRQNQWCSYLEDFSLSNKIKLYYYTSLFSDLSIPAIPGIGKIFKKIQQYISIVIQRKKMSLNNKSNIHKIPKEAVLKTFSPKKNTIAIRYGYRKLSFDPTERSEFFWLDRAGIDYSDILLYNFSTDRILESKTIDELNKRGIRLLGKGPGIPKWTPTFNMKKKILIVMYKILLAFFRCIIKGRWVSYYYWKNLIKLGIRYAYWYDFFKANKVKVNVDPAIFGKVGKVLALNTLKGVSADYQFSVVQVPTKKLSAGENIQFVFSSDFEKKLWKDSEIPVDTFVQTGYVYDRAFKTKNLLKRASEKREELQKNGARFILCFFEGSYNNKYWNRLLPEKNLANEYTYLLKWLFSDPTLGIVFKPKQSVTLYKRLSSISNLVDQAMDTGRCKFLTSDTIVGSIYPVEAALTADACIGKLLSYTAALEARLAGTPTLLVDLEGMFSHPFYSWGNGKVVFRDWESIRRAVEKYRIKPDKFPGFGNWSPVLKDLDPFQDQKASQRMGGYIGTVFNALKQGDSKKNALTRAKKVFEQEWGVGYINSYNISQKNSN